MMKKYLCFLLLLHSVIISSNSYGQQTFQKLFQLNSYNNPGYSFDYTITFNNNLIDVYTDKQECGNNCVRAFYLTVLNENGITLGKKRYSLIYSPQYYPLICEGLNEAYIFAATISGIKKSDYAGIAVINCNKYGKVQWAKQVNIKGLEGSYIKVSAIKTDMLTGNLLMALSVDNNPRLVCLDKNGNTIWTKKIQVHNSFPTISYTINKIEVFGNIIYAGGISVCVDCDYECSVSKGFVIRLNMIDGSYKSFNQFENIYSESYFDCNVVSLNGFAQVDTTVFIIAKMDRYIFNNDPPAYYYVFPFADKEADIPAVQIANDSFALQHYLLSKPGIFKSLKQFYSDGSLVTADIGSINKFDKYGKICPDYKIRVFDSSIVNTKIAIWRYGAKILDEDFIISDISVSDSTGNKTTTICTGLNNVAISSSGQQLNSFNNVNKLDVYPNPVKQQLNINFLPSAKGMFDVNIYSMDKKLLYTIKKSFSKGTNHIQLNIPSLKTGVYFISATNSRENFKGRFIKE